MVVLACFVRIVRLIIFFPFVVAFFGVVQEEEARFQEQLVGLGILRTVLDELALLLPRQPQAKPVGNLRRDAVLHAEQIREVADQLAAH